MQKSVLMTWVLGCFSTGLHAQLSWEVVNRFPLFSERAFESLLSEMEGAGAGIETRLTQVNYRDNVRHLEDSAWDVKTQKYDVSRVLSRTAKIVGRTEWGSADCRWTLTPVSGVSSISEMGTCSKSPRFEVEIGKRYELEAVRSSDAETVRTTLEPKSRLIVSLGDSFSSGEGNPDYPAQLNTKLKNQPPHDWAVDPGYPAHVILKRSAQWLDPTCHRSVMSWPSLYAMRQALTMPDTVVQFMSFACSGAEVLDGFLLPQQNPPGNLGVKAKGKATYVRASQQHALAGALCEGQVTKTDERELQNGLDLFLENYSRGKSKLSFRSCSKPVQPDEVLVQFGGNDARFAGVVKYVFHPPLLNYRGVPIGAQLVATAVNHGLFKEISPVSPQDASPYIQKLPELYALLDEGLRRIGLESSKVSIRMLQYPDPVSREQEVESHEEQLRSCNLRTRDANRPVQSLIAAQLPFRHDGALYGAVPERLLAVQNLYVPKLQSAQVAAAMKHQWVLSDSTEVFRSRGICAGSAECDRLGEQCPIADRVRWAYWPASSDYVFSKRSPPWGNISDFKPYDLEQRRGMRYANDALLTSARYDSNARRVRLDWLAGIAHPTALMHARIADSLEVPLPTSSR